MRAASQPRPLSGSMHSVAREIPAGRASSLDGCPRHLSEQEYAAFWARLNAGTLALQPDSGPSRADRRPAPILSGMARVLTGLAVGTLAGTGLSKLSGWGLPHPEAFSLTHSSGLRRACGQAGA